MAYAQRRIGFSEFQRAQRALKTFTVVLTLETIAARPNALHCVLYKNLGWHMTTLAHQNANNKHGARPADWEIALARNTSYWDIMLYQYAQEI
eukprot:CAMPEP_0119330470 /NCGR_PEP_ID=MMETSP1333-20130426/78346_1 /TAXON_ID=418940 /ORGANISM="Scyphosphaera apsteinii, Strain RCC1455" /LENGTH=92 /DNA_ID=CAMNT_0007339865 /DNA_START=14 /DNA_END=289 /DNA_ORIENTATION=+